MDVAIPITDGGYRTVSIVVHAVSIAGKPYLEARAGKRVLGRWLIPSDGIGNINVLKVCRKTPDCVLRYLARQVRVATRGTHQQLGGDDSLILWTSTQGCVSWPPVA